MALMLEKRSHIDGATFIYFYFLIYKKSGFVGSTQFVINMILLLKSYFINDIVSNGNIIFHAVESILTGTMF